MMKKFTVWMTCILLVLSLAACGGQPEPTTEPKPQQGPESTVQPVETEPVPEETAPAFDPASWGVTEEVYVSNGESSEAFYVNAPLMRGRYAGYGKFSDQTDMTTTFISGQQSGFPEISGLSEVLTGYSEQIAFSMEACYGLYIENVETIVNQDEAVTIGDYEMHRFEGVIASDFDDEPTEFQFVAYAVQLKSNGAYAFWMVYDVSSDQVNGGVIGEYADNMAKTFREEQ